jgi:hypothetical protein
MMDDDVVEIQKRTAVELTDFELFKNRALFVL